VRWDVGLNKKRIAYFMFSKRAAEAELRLVPGDELNLRYSGGLDLFSNEDLAFVVISLLAVGFNRHDLNFSIAFVLLVFTLFRWSK
jgi:hypothetical protein